MAAIYILYSSSLDKFYVGSCKEITERVHQHLAKHFPEAFTAKANDWTIYFYLDNLSYQQARKIELYIKNMKSKKYIENLKRYPELSTKLLRLHPK